ncbi:hypothetical protein VKI21_02690 [Cyanobacterium aponinum UTEX 3222]|nr:hypothetical protein [Cyanobacterium aponinum]WRL42614.1 hypothetical protein VKI21_02690 [Cyanobacterium aponinum UTEX 3222]
MMSNFLLTKIIISIINKYGSLTARHVNYWLGKGFGWQVAGLTVK